MVKDKKIIKAKKNSSIEPGAVDSAKERILEAAFELFKEKGFKLTTTQQITKAAGVNEVTLFRLFGNKRNLFSAVVDEFIISGSISSFNEDLLFDKHQNNPKAFFQEMAETFLLRLKKDMPFMKMHIFESSCGVADEETLQKLAEVSLSGKRKMTTIFKKCAERGWIEKRKSYDDLILSFGGPFFYYLMNISVFGKAVFNESEENLISSIVANFIECALK